MRVMQKHYTIAPRIKNGQIIVKSGKLSVHGYNIFNTKEDNPIEPIYKKMKTILCLSLHDYIINAGFILFKNICRKN